MFLLGRVASILALLWNQSSQPELPVSQAADAIRFSTLEYAMSKLARSSNAVFDRMEFSDRTHESATRGQHKAHDDAFLARVAQTPGVRVATRAEVLRCDGKGPPSCRLNGTDAFFSLSNPVVSGDRATVTLFYQYNSDSKEWPVHYVVYDVTLSLTAGRWQVVELRKVSES